MTTNEYKANYDELRELFEKYLNTAMNNLTDIPEPVLSGIKYAMSAGGKRLRPVLALMTAKMLEVKYDKVLPACLAIELIHNYSLVHDDLPCMDDDELRRGLPTVHVKFGEGMAVLIGDALLNLSMEILAENSTVFGDKLGKILNVIYTNAGAKGMIAGQCVDLESEKTCSDITGEKVEYLHLHKTACLIKAPILSSAILANLSDEDVSKLNKFADFIGLAFQITDDILDIEGDQNLLGKPIGSDEENGKLTYPAVFGLAKSKEIAKECIKNAKAMLVSFKNNEELSLLADSIINRMK